MSLSKIAKKQPLIHCITNYVVANLTANGLLAIGASPIMADAVYEVEEMTQKASALLINIGTLNDTKVEAMLLATKAANNAHVPVVLDPVGVGATAYRKKIIDQLFAERQITLLRCNEGELATIAGVAWDVKGVDSGQGNIDTATVAQAVAKKYDTIVVVTGETDIVTDGEEIYHISGGDIRMTKVTGAGCLLSAICAAILTVEGSVLENIRDLLHAYKKIAKQAGERSDYIGSFQVEVLNGLEQFTKG